jgi:hypothetical protein
MVISMPMCWKCCHQITEDSGEGYYTLIGCEMCDDVVDFASAKQFCPLVGLTGDNKKV